jgi:hypothetical protein
MINAVIGKFAVRKLLLSDDCVSCRRRGAEVRPPDGHGDEAVGLVWGSEDGVGVGWIGKRREVQRTKFGLANGIGDVDGGFVADMDFGVLDLVAERRVDEAGLHALANPFHGDTRIGLAVLLHDKTCEAGHKVALFIKDSLVGARLEHPFVGVGEDVATGKSWIDCALNKSRLIDRGLGWCRDVGWTTCKGCHDAVDLGAKRVELSHDRLEKGVAVVVDSAFLGSRVCVGQRACWDGLGKEGLTVVGTRGGGVVGTGGGGVVGTGGGGVVGTSAVRGVRRG